MKYALDDERVESSRVTDQFRGDEGGIGTFPSFDETVFSLIELETTECEEGETKVVSYIIFVESIGKDFLDNH